MIRNYQVIILLFTLISIAASAVPKTEEGKRVIDHDFQQHLGEEHSKQYDHEQFLGEDQAKTFDQLAPEESRRRLGYVCFILINLFIFIIALSFSKINSSCIAYNDILYMQYNLK